MFQKLSHLMTVGMHALHMLSADHWSDFLMSSESQRNCQHCRPTRSTEKHVKDQILKNIRTLRPSGESAGILKLHFLARTCISLQKSALLTIRIVPLEWQLMCMLIRENVCAFALPVNPFSYCSVEAPSILDYALENKVEWLLGTSIQAK